MADAADTRIKVIRLLAIKLPMLSGLGKDFKPGSSQIRIIRRNKGPESLMKSSNGCRGDESEKIKCKRMGYLSLRF